ncbi:MAG: hypothetical protein EZS28_005878 [Streblomastix strix]|uniref:Uncharacterized protein n=1 Tax=Streblomastix strix TaxID=222440 RepID=A0A5J4WUW3_9EUKA|nr:MAG: hypothetical protein EZS28_005878 [Streblomastix strix]
MSSAGGLCDDDGDDILSVDIEVLQSLLENLFNKRKYEVANMIYIEIKGEIEEEGLIEEGNALVFHSDNRNVIGVQTKVKILNSKINF